MLPKHSLAHWLLKKLWAKNAIEMESSVPGKANKNPPNKTNKQKGTGTLTHIYKQNKLGSDNSSLELGRTRMPDISIQPEHHDKQKHQEFTVTITPRNAGCCQQGVNWTFSVKIRAKHPSREHALFNHTKRATKQWYSSSVNRSAHREQPEIQLKNEKQKQLHRTLYIRKLQDSVH